MSTTKTDLKALARNIVASAESVIADVNGWLQAERATVEQRLGRYEVLLAVALSRGADAKDDLKTKTSKPWTEWARPLIGDGTLSDATLYRWRNAGHVARVLMGEGYEDEADLLGPLPAAMRGSLVPLYRGLDLKAKSDETRQKARKAVRDVYAGLLKAAPTIAIIDREGTAIEVPQAPTYPEVLAASEKAFGKSSRGGSGKAGNEDENGGNEDENGRADGSGGIVPVDPKAVEVASGPVASILIQAEKDAGIPQEKARALMLATCRLVEAHTVSVVAAVLSGAAEKAALAEAEKAEATEDEKAVEAEAAQAEAEAEKTEKAA